MDIYQTLHKEHEEVAKLFSNIEHTSSAAIKTREKVFQRIKKALELHSRAEEKVFYPELKKHEESHFQSLEASEEHHMLDLLLKELASMPKDTENWLAKLIVLKEAVVHHVEQEENELFPMARSFMDPGQADEMARKFIDQKKRLH